MEDCHLCFWVLKVSKTGNWEKKLHVKRVRVKTNATLEAAVITTPDLDDMSALQKDNKVIQQTQCQCVLVAMEPGTYIN